MSKLIDFYLDEGVNNSGDKIGDIWQEDDDYFEFCHSHIQWLFPVPEPSNFNPDAPILTNEDITLFKSNPVLKDNLQSSFRRFMEFLGLEYQAYNNTVIKTDNFYLLAFTMPNHNWLRITRVLRSLKLLGLEDEANAFFNFLKDIHEKEGYVSENSFNYWQAAINS
jgi:Opioid growth factor receptor (OGFr) conserved region